MRTTITVACVQHCATDAPDKNLQTLSGLIGKAADKGAAFVALPEACDYLSNADGAMKSYAKPAESHEALSVLSSAARDRSIWLLIGSLTMRNDDGSIVNRSLILDPAGEVRAFYDKIHMFDACVPGMKLSSESSTYRPGSTALTASLPWACLGLSICYDLRFPQLYRTLAQAGAEILTVPAAFTRPTGEAHWHVLLRSRAIENGCFVIAPAQWGHHYGNRYSYGHSLIIDPWGTVLADAGDGDAFITATLNLNRVQECRAAISSLKHDRPFALKQVD